MSAAEVSRSDSNRSDASQKPRVSFNRDVHVKRIVSRENTRTPTTGISSSVTTPPVRKERIKRTKKELTDEAAEVLRQVDSVDCIARQNGKFSENFYTVPRKGYSTLSLDRKINKRRSSLEASPPKKPPRSFTESNQSGSSFFDIFKKSEKGSTPKTTNLRRSVSDVSSLKSKKFGQPTESSKLRKKSESDSEGTLNAKNKKQLSPIIEATQQEDYFAPHHQDKENIDNNVLQVEKSNPNRESITEKLKEYIDEIDEEIYKETGIRYNSTEPRKEPLPIIIDLDKAEKISSGKKSKFKYSALGKKIKSLAQRKSKTHDDSQEEIQVNNNLNLEGEFKEPHNGLKDQHQKLQRTSSVGAIAPKIKTAITDLENNMSAKKSAGGNTEKTKPTKGGTVDRMVKRLSSVKCSSPPPRPVPLVTPNKETLHNNNLPFSYTNSFSTEKLNAKMQPGPTKHTIHTIYPSTRKQPQSDSDEGLGCDESLGKKCGTDISFTHFGDQHFRGYQNSDYFDDIDKLKESPILPKYKSPTPLGGFSETKMEYTKYMDSLNRGCADGMDAKRRESPTEPHENRININISYKDTKTDVRNDLAKRRDLLESRINRRINDIKSTTPEYPRDPAYLRTKTSQTSLDYRSNSPIDRPLLESKISGYKEREEKYITRHITDYSLNSFDSEPKSFDSLASDYRSSPENKYSSHSRHKLLKNREMYKSTPEIRHVSKYHNNSSRETAYHDSLRKGQRIDPYINSKMYGTDTYYNNLGSAGKLDKFVDSGIETDMKRESADSYRLTKSSRTYREYLNESEDEGFASSLLINSERQHTADSINSKSRRGYESDRTTSREDDIYRYGEDLNYKNYALRDRNESDDSYYDTKYEKDNSTIKQLDIKPPKPEKRTSLDKVKSLFTRDSKKKKEKALREERLKNMKYKKEKEAVANKLNDRIELYTDEDDPYLTNIDDETIISVTNSNSRNLRFFGDTDAESNGSLRAQNKSILKNEPISRNRTARDSRNILSERQINTNTRNKNHKLNNESGKDRELKRSYMNHKPPISPSRAHSKGISRHLDDKTRRSKNEFSSVESSTEGESSQQSQRSVVYLHAASVGDIPSPGYLRSGRRTASREEISSNVSSRIQPHIKTLSRSFSVLAPWKPRHSRESMDIDYSQYPKKSKYERKTSSIQRENPTTLRKKKQDNGRYNLREARSKESLTLKTSAEETEKGSNSTLYKKKNRLPKENYRYSRDRDEKKISSKSYSVESLNRKSNSDKKPDISRSVSMPRDNGKMAGWFKKSKNT